MKIFLLYVCCCSVVIAMLLKMYHSELDYRYYKLTLPDKSITEHRKVYDWRLEDLITEYNNNL